MKMAGKTWWTDSYRSQQAMSFNSSTPSLWDQRPAQDVVHKFTTMAVASPHGVEGLATGALSPPPPSRSDQATERITELSRYFFKEVSVASFIYLHWIIGENISRIEIC